MRGCWSIPQYRVCDALADVIACSRIFIVYGFTTDHYKPKGLADWRGNDYICKKITS